VTSHSRNSSGVAKREREELVRFEVKGEALANVRVFTYLKDALGKLDPWFLEAAGVDGNNHGGLNIEGLAWDPEHARLLIGFRSPRHRQEAQLVWLQNPDAVFDRGEEPVLLPPVGLALDGEGIRDVAYSPTLHGFVIASGAARRRDEAAPTLWLWKGGPAGAVKLRASGLDELNPEGLADVATGHGRALLVVSDDGSSTKGRYVLLPFEGLLP
jgi:hypothetical protein